jgi:hypothetical protein
MQTVAQQLEDDFALFDVVNDLPSWFLAEHVIGRVWEDREARARAFAHYGIRDEAHFLAVRSSVARFIRTPWARNRWGDGGTLKRMKAAVAAEYDSARPPPSPSVAPPAPSAPPATPPISLELYVEIAEARHAAALRGMDGVDVLQRFAMTPARWTDAAAWWAAQFAPQNVGAGALRERFRRIQEHFQRKYGTR